MLDLGFTGTRYGMTDVQRAGCTRFLEEHGAALQRFHHGACQGSDAQAHRLVRGLAPHVKILCYPGPEGDEHCALQCLEDADEVLPRQGHFARNRAIVNAVSHLLATPNTMPDPARATGGTWYTINFAHKRDKPVTLLPPTGAAGAAGTDSK
jgi:hypothetical protein